MATLDELAILLAGGPSKEALSAANPYTQFQAIPDQIGGLTTQLAVQAPGRFSTRDLMLSALASGLGSGILGGLGEDYNNTLSDRYSKAVLGFAGGVEPTTESSQLPSTLLKEARNKGNLFQAMDYLEKRKAAADIKNQVTSKLYETLATKGKTLSGDGQVVDLFDLAKEEAEQKKLNKIAEIQGEAEGYGLSPELNPNSPQYKQKKDLEAQKIELRKELEGQQSFKDFQMADKGYRAMVKAMSDPQGTSDLDLVYGAIQMIEPGMAVREGEQNAVRNTGSIPDQWKSYILGSMTTGAKLPPEVRQGIIRLAARRYDEHARSFNATAEYFNKEATRMGLPGDSLSYMLKADTADSVAKSLGYQPTNKMAPTVSLQGVGQIEVTDDILQQAISELNRRGVKLE